MTAKAKTVTDSNQDELKHYAESCKELIKSQNTLLLSTITADDKAEISYSPYIQDQQGTFYIFVSELATHTANLLCKQQASVLFIRPESASKNLFARERVVFNCRASEVCSDSENYDNQLLALEGKFGEVVGLLRSLKDFHLIALSPLEGQYVVGFGNAFRINPADGTLSHIVIDRS